MALRHSRPSRAWRHKSVQWNADSNLPRHLRQNRTITSDKEQLSRVMLSNESSISSGFIRTKAAVLLDPATAEAGTASILLQEAGNILTHVQDTNHIDPLPCNLIDNDMAA